MTFPTTSLRDRYEAKSETAYTSGDVATTVTDQNAITNLHGTGLTWQDSVLNGHAVYRFDGIDDYAISSTLGGSTSESHDGPWTISTVAKNVNDTRWTFGINFNTGRIFSINSSGGEWGHFTRTEDPGGGTVSVNNSGATGTSFAVLTLVWDGTDVTFYLDGTAVNGPTALGGTLGMRHIHMGGEEPTGGFFGGDIALGAVWRKALDATERAALHTYVQDTYGITVSDYSGVAGPVGPFLRTTGGYLRTPNGILRPA